MSDREPRDKAADEALIPSAGVGGQAIVPSDNSLFGPEPESAPDDRGVNEEDIGLEDDGLLDPGASPEFDHSLRRRPSDPS